MLNCTLGTNEDFLIRLKRKSKTNENPELFEL